ncbi:alpha/beta hydrolase [Robiginitomaculum antarcticum]|uniref:alpha/beta hydrolase n=1 Tax=Robiginitomaculum antarcticum TaxID=437507 RepID=UPI00037987D1|nr:alpha/beta hydrolase [Robiginitomaculum antarcticum]
MTLLKTLPLAVLLLSACQAKTPEPTATTPVKVEVPIAIAKPVMSWGDLTSRTKPAPTTSVTFGDAETDIVDVWIPQSKGPHPVVIMVHGGCWQKSIADRTLMNYAAEHLRENGMAVWNIEYRGVDEEGGGYPGTFIDVSRAADLLPDYAQKYNLDLNRIAGLGHSAGGHLITWLAGRENLPEGSALYTKPQIDLIGVVNSGGLADLDASEPLTLPGCLTSIKDSLTGLPNRTRADVLAETSSDRLLPMGVIIHSVNGARDTIAPPVLGQQFTAKATEAGDAAYIHIIADEGHVELIAPGSVAFDKQTKILKDMLGVK